MNTVDTDKFYEENITLLKSSINFDECQAFLDFSNKKAAGKDSGFNFISWCKLMDFEELLGNEESFPQRINCRLKRIGGVINTRLNKSEKFGQLSFEIKGINSGLEEFSLYKKGDKVKEEIGNKYALYNDTSSNFSYLFLYIPRLDCYWLFSVIGEKYQVPGEMKVKVFVNGETV